MRLVFPQQLKNECFEAIRRAQLDPADFFWGGQTSSVAGGVEALILKAQPEGFISARFEFGFYSDNWAYHYVPGTAAPYTGGRAGGWAAEMSAFDRWLETVKAEIGSPDLWAALERERELLLRPGEIGPDNNEPFTAEELANLRAQIVDLKRYIASAPEFSETEARTLEARLDYAEQLAPRLGRFDWWNLFAGALITLVLTGVVSSGDLQGLFFLAVRGFAGLIGSSPHPGLGP